MHAQARVRLLDAPLQARPAGLDGAITRVKGPLGATDANLAQNTMRFAANYAVNDFVALDVGEIEEVRQSRPALDHNM